MTLAAAMQQGMSVRIVSVRGSPIPVNLIGIPHDSAWAVAASIATVGLFIVALAALLVAAKQLATVKDERTISLIKEGSSELETVLGFFDFAADVRVSREAFSMLYQRLIRARSPELRQAPVADVLSASRAALVFIEKDLDGDEPEARDAIRERELRERVIAATNFLERVSALLDKKVINPNLFFRNQDYNIVAPYYVLEPILQDLEKHEGFDFSDARGLAARAQPFLNWLPEDHVLRTTNFSEASTDGPTLREV